MPARRRTAAASTPPLYVACLRIAGELCVVVGGGAVATRKIMPLLESDARVRVVSPALTPELHALVDSGRVVWRARAYVAKDVAGARLVFAATDDPALNRLVAEEARAMGIWVNVASGSTESTGGEFGVPATLRRGELTVAIATGGGAPGYARRLREHLAAVIGPEYGVALALYARARPAILAADPARQAALWDDLFALDLPAVLRARDGEAGKEAGQRLLAEWLARMGLAELGPHRPTGAL